MLIVRYKYAREMQFIVQTTESPAQFVADLGVESAERLVQQEHIGTHGERTSESNALSLTARQLSGVAIARRAQLHEIEQ